MKKFLAIICILLSLVTLFCSCESTPDTDKESETETKTEAPTQNETESETVTDAPTEPVPATVTYKITVVDENGNPVVGATVQLCVGDLCRLPCPSDANGVATFEETEDAYTAKVFANGYVSDEAGYTFPDGSYELTITLTKAE